MAVINRSGRVKLVLRSELFNSVGYVAQALAGLHRYTLQPEKQSVNVKTLKRAALAYRQP
jgi:hypothetical protein